MKKSTLNNSLLLFLFLFVSYSMSAQRNSWNKVNNRDININSSEIINYDISLTEPHYYKLDKLTILNKLSQAPYRENATGSNVIINIPNDNDGFDQFEMFKVKTFADQLANNYQDILSFVGKSVNDRDPSLLRITITPFGFYVMVLKPNVGQFFINPYDKNGEYYVAFNKSNAIDLAKPECMFDEINGGDQLLIEDQFENQTFDVDDGNLRTYRLAMACTGEYAQFHINQAGLNFGTTAQKITAVLSAITVTVDRINSIYERDLGVTLQLISNNDQIIYLDGNTDPYTNSSVSTMLQENQTNLDDTIFSSNYDIGHIVSTANAGGVAAYQSLCNNFFKAYGATGGVSPVGDPFDVDYVSHEIGHQFGASHTQNNSCQRNSSTAVEPGSASTIMGYAGICPPNIQSNSDAYFHQVSISEIFQHIGSGSGSTCASFSGQPNTAPSISPVPDYTIPNGTAFYLDVTATDTENDALTYNWEQYDNGISPSHPPQPTFTIGPNFRSLPSSTESRRYFPNIDDVLQNNLAPTWEVIPEVARSMDFVVTVRDNNVNVGQSSREFVAIDFANVGPFQITSQNTQNINWLPGQTRIITWDVAGTTANGINTSNVNILLSSDGGQNFTTVLVSNTANDGTENIIVPNIQAESCRILIEPVDNVYFAVNSQSFSIDTNVITNCQTFSNPNAVIIQDGLGTPQNPQNGPVGSSDITIPSNISNIDDINVTLDVSHTQLNDLTFQLVHPNGVDFISLWSGNCSDEDGFNVTFNDSGASLPGFGANCPNPLVGTYDPVDNSTDLATLFSLGTSGDWTLLFADFISQNTGTLNSWEIEICTTTFSVEDNTINNFSISPNPNNGVFDLNFTEPLSNDAEISIFDIQGRLVEKVNYSNNSNTMRIQLQNQFSSGVYLLEILDNGLQSVKKLIIN